MEKIINKLFEAESDAHKLVEKAKLDKDWSTELCNKELSRIRKKRFEETEAMLKLEIEDKKKSFDAETDNSKIKHEEDKKSIQQKYQKLQDQLIADMFKELIRI
ncbi:MAG: hypothetical protein A2Y17_08895 [Clostridiales bacterium GWF2_38_85]|nr:MAG: hypothetical protein A2Y17_08895 [Clostridiales bacterium GWF2_38_85]HBL83687.1 hypothetical protein [Clostridiales bacterium]